MSKENQEVRDLWIELTAAFNRLDERMIGITPSVDDAMSDLWAAIEKVGSRITQHAVKTGQIIWEDQIT